MILRCIIFSILCSQLCGKETIKTYWEENGIVAVDIEDVEAKKPWKKETTLKGFTGESYYIWRGGNSFGRAGGGTMEFNIIISRPGEYNLSIYNRHDFHDSTLENDCFTQMDDDKWVKTFSSKKGEWIWQATHEWSGSKKIPAKYTLNAGLHTFRISARSKNFSIDRFHLWHTSLNKKNTLNTNVKLTDSDFPIKPKSLENKRISAYWNSGKFGMVVRESNALLQKGESQEASDAIEAVNNFAEKRKAQINKLKEFAPSLAFQSLRNLASSLSYTAHEKDIKEEILALSRDKDFQMSLQSEKIYLKALDLFQSAKSKMVKGKPKPLSKRTIESLTRAAKDIKKRCPDSPFYDDLATKLEKENINLE